MSRSPNKTILFTTFLGFILFIFNVSNAKTINLEEAIKYALDNNRDAKIALMNVDKADAAIHEAYGYAYPNVDISANFAHFIEKPKMPFPDFEAMLTNATYEVLFNERVIPYDPSKFIPMNYKLQSFSLSNSYEAKAQFSQILFNNTVFNGIGASKKYYDLSVESLKSTISKTINTVKKAFYGVLLTKSMLEITSASFKNAQDNLSNVKALLAQGLVSDYDAMQAEVQVENIRPIVLQMENTYKNTKDGLKIVLGINPNEEIELTGELEYNTEEVPQEQASIDKAINKNFDLSTMKYKKDVDNAWIDFYRSDYWPSLAAFGNYSFNGNSDNFNFQHYRSSIVGVQLSMNIFKGFQTSNKVQQSQIAYQQTEEQYSQLKDFTISQVKAKILDLETVKNKINAQERNIQLAQKTYSIANLRYKDGTGNQLEVQNADMALRQARTNRLQSVFEYISAKTDLEQLLGQVDKKYLDKYIK